MEFVWIGWCRKDNSDKIWAVYALESVTVYPMVWRSKKTLIIDKYATIWGRRGKVLQCKVFEGDPYKKIREKRLKGYKQVGLTDLSTVYPEFQQDLEKSAFWATLKG